MLKQDLFKASLIFFVLTGICLYSLQLFEPPKSLPASIPVTEFSAARAGVYLEKIAQFPHAMGTTAHAALRKYLLDEFGKLGVETRVQETTISITEDKSPSKAYVYNIIGKVKGKQPGRAVLLVAHYDSQPNTLGAADDGAGVAAMLATADALVKGPPLQNDVLLLLTDGEEYGMLGARAFLKDPLAKEVAMVINMEARGNSGPCMTFEMSSDNGWVADQFIRAAPYPMASSLYYEAYKMLPNYTDFSIFRNAGYAGVNSAFIDGFANYHKLTDSYPNLDKNSLQQQGANLLALARHFGNISLDHTKAPDKTFFNIAGTWMIAYPMNGNILLCLITGVLLFISVTTGGKRKMIRGRAIGSGLLLYIGTLIAGVALSFGLSKLLPVFMPFYHSGNGTFSPWTFCAGFILIALAIYAWALGIFSGRIGIWSLLSAIQLLFYFISLIQLFVLPSTTYLFIVPLLFSCLSTLVVFRIGKGTDKTTWSHLAILMAGLLPAIFILFPLSVYFFIAFDVEMPFISVLFFLLLLGFASPLLGIVEKSFRKGSFPTGVAVLVVAAIITLTFAVRANGAGEEHPISSQVAYYLNADSGKACWTTNYDQLDDWNRQFFPSPFSGTLSEIYPYAARQFLKNTAGTIDQLPPLAEKIDSGEDAAGQRTVYLLSSPRQAAHMEILLIPARPGDLVHADINGENIPLDYIKTASGDVLLTQFFGLPVNKQLRLQLIAKKDAAFRLILCDRSIGLPEELVKKSRRNDVIFEQGNSSNITVIKKTYCFGQN